MMILSETPAILSFFPNAEASNRWSVVFSKDANIRTLSFILATPKRVIPKTSPCCSRTKSACAQRCIASKAYLISHDIAKQHDMARINIHTVFLHCVLNFVDYGWSSSFNAQHLSYFNDMVGRSLLAHDSYSTKISKQEENTKVL